MFFKCYFQQSELTTLQNYLSQDEFCIIHVPVEKFCYGIMTDEFHSKFMDILSGETLEKLEYLDENDFKNMVSNSKTGIIGNEDLFNKLK